MENFAPQENFPQTQQEPPSHVDTQQNNENPPNNTIYIRNLNEKIKLEELKTTLREIFGIFGNILDVVALKTVKMRGQAFVVFEDMDSASRALVQMQGFEFHEKNMEIQYAKTKSDAIAKKDGTYQPRPRNYDAKRKRDLENAKRKKQLRLRQQQQGHANSSDERIERALFASQPALPSNVLFLENLPDEANEMMLNILFSRFGGYKEARLVPGKTGIAFVEFESEPQATHAMGSLQGFKITEGYAVKISYRK